MEKQMKSKNNKQYLIVSLSIHEDGDGTVYTF